MTTGFHLGYFAVGSILFGRSLLACATMRRVPFVPELVPETAEPTRLTAVVLATAVDDALISCVDDLRTQRDCAVDVVVVQDRSEPTGAASLTAGRPWLRVLHTPQEPADVVPWNAGFALGAAAAPPETAWLLLLERPHRVPHPDALRRAVRHAELERAAVVWLVPRLRTPAVTAPSRLTSLADAMPAMAAANRDLETVHWPGLPCVGRRDLLEAALRDPQAPRSAALEALIAERLHATGRRARYAFASDELDAGRLSGADLAESVERLLATTGFRTGAVTLGVVLFALLWATAIHGAIAANVWGLFACGGLASLAIPAWLVARATRANPLAALFAPIAFPVEAAVTLTLAFRAVTRREVRWRGRTIPTASLRSQLDDSRPDDDQLDDDA